MRRRHHGTLVLLALGLGADPSRSAVTGPGACVGDSALRPGPFRLEGRRLSAEAVRSDLRFLRRTIEIAHGDPYRMLAAGDVAEMFAQAEGAARETSGRAFYSLVACLLARFGDGHLLSLPAVDYADSLSQSVRVFPARIGLVGDRVVIAASATASLPVGSEVLAIDGRPVAVVIDDLHRRLPVDALADGGPRYRVGREFARLYSLHVAQPDTFTVELSGGRVRVAAMPIADALPLPRAAPAPARLEFPTDDVALLRVASFAADDWAAANLAYDSVLGAAFGAIRRRAPHDLILDLRGNEGGRDSYGARLLARLMDRPFRYYRRLVTRVDSVPFWRATLNLDSTFNARFRSGLHRLGDTAWVLDESRHPNLRMQHPIAPAFPGRVWVLVDGGTNSTAAEFAAVAQGLGRARIVGEETGGTYEGNTSGTFAIVALPASGVRVAIPLVRYDLEVPAPPVRGRGVLPDLPVTPTTEDVIGRADSWLAVTFEAIAGARKEPEMFAPGDVSTSANELNAAFVPSGDTLYYTRAAGDDGRFGTIVVSHYTDAGWTPPQVTSFSGQFSDYDPFVAPDGRRLYFVSNRPAPGVARRSFDLWYVERAAGGWGEPARLAPPVNSERDEFYPSVAANGTLYFSSCGRADGHGSCDVYRSVPVDGAYRMVENLGDSVNTPAAEVDAFIAPDERYLVFTVYGRPDDLGGGDLYLAERLGAGWSVRHLPPPINSNARDYCPIVSPDGRWLYFTSQRGFMDEPLAGPLSYAALGDSLRSLRNGFGNIYRVNRQALRSR